MGSGKGERFFDKCVFDTNPFPCERTLIFEQMILTTVAQVDFEFVRL